jgi:hypothetical protein
MSDRNQTPATCSCCTISSTDGTASLCWQCEDERVDGRYDGQCPTRAIWERRRSQQP